MQQAVGAQHTGSRGALAMRSNRWWREPTRTRRVLRPYSDCAATERSLSACSSTERRDDFLREALQRFPMDARPLGQHEFLNARFREFVETLLNLIDATQENRARGLLLADS